MTIESNAILTGTPLKACTKYFAYGILSTSGVISLIPILTSIALIDSTSITPLALVPLMLPIEIISNLARLISLSIRLFGNITGHELVLGILFLLAGAAFAPLPIMALGIFVSLLQAFVFLLLSIIYFSGAMEHAH